MSIETTCPNCFEEYDMRHGECPACSIQMNVRGSIPPYNTWPATGHWPFEMDGERYAVTTNPAALGEWEKWRVSHVETGTSVPGSAAATKEQAIKKAKDAMANAGPEKVKRAIEYVRMLISRSTPPASGANREDAK